MIIESGECVGIRGHKWFMINDNDGRRRIREASDAEK
jgi:hypothetical protein